MVPNLERGIFVAKLSVPSTSADSSVVSLSRYCRDLPTYLQEQLVRYSTTGADPDIIRFTSDNTRFRDLAAVAEWLKKGRTIYPLTDLSETTLHGIIWFGHEPLPENFEYTKLFNHSDYVFTFAYRLWGAMRGKGLGRVQFQLALTDFMANTDQYRQHNGSGFWEWTSADNRRVLAVEAKLGFQVVSLPNAANKVISIASTQQLQQALGIS